MALSNGQRMQYSLRNVVLAMLYRGFDIHAPGKARSNGRRKRAARPVRIWSYNPFCFENGKALSVKQHIGWITRQMASLDQHICSAHAP